MFTHKTITDKLERRILANALLKFRNIQKPEVIRFKWYLYASMWDGLAMDSCYIDTSEWKLKKVDYQKLVGSKAISHTIHVA